MKYILRLRKKYIAPILLGFAAIAFLLLFAVPKSSKEASDRNSNTQTPRGVAGDGGLPKTSDVLANPTEVQGPFTEKIVSGPRVAAMSNVVFDSQALRLALSSNDAKTVEAAFDALELCASLSNLRQLHASIDRNSDAGKQLPNLESRIRSGEASCAGSDHDLVSRRASYLRDALARTFSPGLAKKFYQAGPNGNWDDVQLRADDLLIQQWFEHAEMLLARAADAGDVESMQILAHIYREGPASRQDQVKALAYQIAQTELQIRNQVISKDSPTVAYLNRERGQVSGAVKAAADSAAKNILVTCCKIRYP